MSLVWLGSAGVGCVWGWLGFAVTRATPRPWRAAAWLAAVSLLAAAEVLAFAPMPAPALFAIAALLAGGAHAAWCRDLRARYRS